GGAATHDERSLRPVGSPEAITTPLELAPRRGIDQAADPIGARSPTPAHLIAGDAWADVCRAPPARLVRRIRIRCLAPDDADHIGLARGDDIVGVLRRADMALGLHADMLDDLLQRLGEGRPQFVFIEEGRHDLWKVEVAAGAAGDVVIESARI